MQLKRAVFFSFILLVFSMMTGCATNRETASITPGSNLQTMKNFYIVKHPNDTNDVASLIKGAMEKKGYTTTVGPEIPPPYPADGVITYIDKWQWDLSMYLLELTINVRQPNNFPIATGNSLHTSLTRLSPPNMVSEVLNNIYKETN